MCYNRPRNILVIFFTDHNTGPSPHPPTPPYPTPPGGGSGGTSRPRNPAYLIHAERGAVASEAELCSQIGVDVLKVDRLAWNDRTCAYYVTSRMVEML